MIQKMDNCRLRIELPLKRDYYSIFVVGKASEFINYLCRVMRRNGDFYDKNQRTSKIDIT